MQKFKKKVPDDRDSIALTELNHFQITDTLL
jgi:hypothetical protein